MKNEDRLLFVLSNMRCLQIYMYSKFDKSNPDQNKLNEYIINQKENLEILKEIFFDDTNLENRFGGIVFILQDEISFFMRFCKNH